VSPPQLAAEVYVDLAREIQAGAGEGAVIEESRRAEVGVLPVVTCVTDAEVVLTKKSDSVFCSVRKTFASYPMPVARRNDSALVLSASGSTSVRGGPTPTAAGVTADE
jgi:hypothetical protein